MNPSNRLLSEIVAFRTYAKYLPHLGRRESFEETINRCLTMHLDRFPKLSRDIIKAFQKVHEKKVMPSMRSLQFAGEAILKNNIRQYNCGFVHINNPRAFGEALFLLLSGTGVGYSVQKRHVNELPIIKLPREEGIFIIHDSIQGWAQSLDILLEAYFFNRIRPIFDFSKIRPKGSYLVTSGAKAPGPEPLKSMLLQVENKLKQAIGRTLKSIEIHDIICISADCVLSGGIRRAALISLFDKDDNEMLEAKHGNWQEKYPHRARANNSAVLLRDKSSKEEFNYIFQKCIDSNCGEPGFDFTSDLDWGANPCHEISLHSNQLCNLTTINQSGIKDKKDFLSRVYSATLIGTLQASYTNFPYIRPAWQLITEQEALLGVSFTGIADNGNKIPKAWLKEAARLAKKVNEQYSKIIGINLSARITTVKPEGTSSCVFSSSSGIHARHSEYYLRRIRMNKNDALANYLSKNIPELMEDDFFSPNGVVFTIPQESPSHAILRINESSLDLFQRALYYHDNWIKPGHRMGINTHNVSLTISYKSEEINELREAMWNNRNKYNAISLLPFDGGIYQQAPFETCNKETFDKYNQMIKEIDLRKIKEEEDNTERINMLACIGGVCELEL